VTAASTPDKFTRLDEGILRFVNAYPTLAVTFGSLRPNTGALAAGTGSLWCLGVLCRVVVVGLGSVGGGGDCANASVGRKHRKTVLKAIIESASI